MLNLFSFKVVSYALGGSTFVNHFKTIAFVLVRSKRANRKVI